ncbi:GTP-binding protein Der [Thermosipho melanesiensis]|uniref:GTPase Der n=2 Tax=Thermosipho melanesiensis TaxID=46541 RepID=DER_THEM4|nr:ribosome biogenesis GTPase Der [Thermosipho melanesiensis]A6LNG7.1 RecName: Full=GTPase Der; AltName: Full=GTP-binding protein EngA [Thermosipho melanesiensis BI429]ABR31468.1 small GTP-binding protein [Thermosipho melanesiensis BI429]APT74526.1 GTP-binding protein Der [Thermosipho melanesiensis]OOC36478.1 GTP-binding protein Der [Thermosipho melanesiensis]OOC37296.1 GTP-binding protein Der [Thermosipho melanesiensis]OOC38049.1 GTP-binding protein Der [Thermosipho melanesiensis]
MATVLIVGKSNVGKSTLFNKLIGKKKSIVDNKEGVTRDAVSDRVSYFGKSFKLIDTCGIFERPEDIISERLKNLTLNMLSEGDIIIFVVDGKYGLTSEDYHLADLLRKSNSDVILVVNKSENEKKVFVNFDDFYSLGFGEPLFISAEQGKNIDRLIEEVIKRLEKKGLKLEEEEEKDSIIRVALIGRPNAGKSTLFNGILERERALVTPIPGTTRDAIDELVEINGKKYLFIDTAGLRRKSKVEYKSIDMYSNVRSIKSIELSDVVVFVIDSLEGITHQDQKIAGIAENRGKATVVVFNKIDLVKNFKYRKQEFIEHFMERLYFVSYSPVVFVSAQERYGIGKLIKAIKEAYNSLFYRVQTSAVNAVIQRMIMFSPPPRGLKIYYGAQVDVKPPTFLFFTNGKKVPEFYQNNIRKIIRENIYHFTGAPIFLKFKNRH